MATAHERVPQVLLRVGDLARSLAFYQSLPGFAVTLVETGIARVTGPQGVVLLLAADESRWEGVPVARPTAWVYIYRPDVPGLAAELAAHAILREGWEEPYPGYRQLLLPDPDGYQIAFWEPMPISDPEMLALYRIGPARLQHALTALGAAGLDTPWAPGKWTVRQIVHHIVDSELATFQVIRMALALPGRQIQTDVWEADEFADGLDTAHRAVEPALALLTATRAWVLEAIGHLPGALDRTVSWPSGYQAAVRDLLRQTGGHAIHHILQIEALAQTDPVTEPFHPLPDSFQ